MKIEKNQDSMRIICEDFSDEWYVREILGTESGRVFSVIKTESDEKADHTAILLAKFKDAPLRDIGNN